MNIWIVTSEFPPAASGGGIGTYCVEFGNALVRNGHAVTVFAAKFNNDEISTALTQNFPVVWTSSVPENEIESSLGHWHRLAYKFADSVVARLKAVTDAPDAIEVQDFGGLGYFLLKRKLVGEPTLANIPIIVMCHTPSFEVIPINEEPSFRFPNYWVGRSEKFCLLAADAVISPSRFLAERLSAVIPREISTCSLPMHFAPRELTPRSRAEVDLLYVGRFELRKGVLQLLSGMRRLWDKGHRFKLKMIGGDTPWNSQTTTVRNHIEGKYQAYMQQGLLEISQSVPREELWAIQSKAACLVVPSVYENFPYVCIEAMSQGMPILASSTGGHAEMVGKDGTCGIVFDWNQPGQFEAAVLAMLEKSPAERQMMGERGKTRIAEICDADAFVERRVASIAELTARPPAKEPLYPFLNQFVDTPPIAPPTSGASASTIVAGALTVVVPYFNLGAFVRETISSIMGSTFPEIRVLVVDDGSTDADSIKVLDEIAAATWRFPLDILRIPNGGLANARNVGAEAAETEFIAFLDADDMVEKNYYDACMKVLQRYSNVSFVFSWLQYVGNGSGIWVNFDTEFPYMLCANMLAPMQVVRRSHFLEYGKNDASMRYGMEDYEAWIRMVASGCLGVSLPRTLCRYRVRHNSMSRVWNSDTVLLLREWMQRANPEIFRRWGKEALQLQDINGPGWLWDNPAKAYSRVGYVPAGAAQDSLARLRWRFSDSAFSELVRLLDEPAAVWLIQAALRIKLHRLGIGFAKVLLAIRRLFPIRQPELDKRKT